MRVEDKSGGGDKDITYSSKSMILEAQRNFFEKKCFNLEFPIIDIFRESNSKTINSTRKITIYALIQCSKKGSLNLNIMKATFFRETKLKIEVCER